MRAQKATRPAAPTDVPSRPRQNALHPKRDKPGRLRVTWLPRGLRREATGVDGAASRNCRSTGSCWLISFILIGSPRSERAFQFLAATQDIGFHRAKRNVE